MSNCLTRWRLLFWFNETFPSLAICEHCLFSGTITATGVLPESSYTMYLWDGKGVDPNRATYLCRSCEVEHREYWKDMWSNVPGYGG